MMIIVWWLIALVLILIGLFLCTQGGAQIGRGLLLVGICIALILIVHPARARDDGRYASSPLKQWFDGLKSERGPCCSDADGTALSDVDWEVKDGHYRVRVPIVRGGQPEWTDVPEDALITEPNRYGRAMVWPMYGIGGLNIRCFIPGSMT